MAIGDGLMTLKHDGYLGHYIERDNYQLLCPFLSWPPRHLDGPKVCGPWCPHFQLRRRNGEHKSYTLTLTCGRGSLMVVEDGL
jgi:hypothetical protein